ncbi:hypothetical protein IKG60_01090 [Candidatus Saccharibacteria bacterium]|nr:hypothetical protein [Candidatus Saccharibacteria bacterium]
MIVEGKKHFKGGLGVLIAALCFVIVLLIVAIVIINVNGRCECDDTAGYTLETEDEEESAEQNLTADEIAELGQQIEAAETPAEKAELLMERAIRLWYDTPSNDEKRFDEIIADLEDAEALNPTMTTAWWLYYVTEAKGDHERAAEYLDLAKKRGYDEDMGAG